MQSKTPPVARWVASSIPLRTSQSVSVLDLDAERTRDPSGEIAQETRVSVMGPGFFQARDQERLHFEALYQHSGANTPKRTFL